MNLRFFLVCLPGLALLQASAQPHEPVRTDVFLSESDGYHTYRIPAMVVTRKGTLLAFCEGRKDGAGDSGAIDLLLKRSTNGGTTWTPQNVVWSDGQNTCGNPAPVIDEQNGLIWLLMTWNLGSDTEQAITRGTSQNSRRVFVTHSSDEGATWARPVDITPAVKRPDWHWYATGPVNGIQITRGPHRGRLMIPANHSELIDGQAVTRSHVIFSDDHGTTWQIGGSEEEKTNESTIVELADGRVLQNMRSYHRKNRRALASSEDGGLTWSPVRLDQALIEPVCQGSMLRASWPAGNTPSAILFCNPASLKRENLTIRVSYDEGKSWSAGRVLHSGPAAYSCLALLPDQTVCCLFECGEKTAYEKISLGRFSLDWVHGPRRARD